MLTIHFILSKTSSFIVEILQENISTSKERLHDEMQFIGFEVRIVSDFTIDHQLYLTEKLTMLENKTFCSSYWSLRAQLAFSANSIPDTAYIVSLLQQVRETTNSKEDVA